MELSDKNLELLKNAVQSFGLAGNVIRAALLEDPAVYQSYSQEVWRHEVAHQETLLGYLEWVATRLTDDDSVPTPKSDDPPSFYLDIPTLECIANPLDGPWCSIGRFPSKEVAVAFIRKHFGPCDDEGRLPLLSFSDNDTEGEILFSEHAGEALEIAKRDYPPEPGEKPEFLNRYECKNCGHKWHMLWQFACDDQCFQCRKIMEPIDSTELP